MQLTNDERHSINVFLEAKCFGDDLTANTPARILIATDYWYGSLSSGLLSVVTSDLLFARDTMGRNTGLWDIRDAHSWRTSIESFVAGWVDKPRDWCTIATPGDALWCWMKTQRPPLPEGTKDTQAFPRYTLDLTEILTGSYAGWYCYLDYDVADDDINYTIHESEIADTPALAIALAAKAILEARDVQS